MMNKTVLVVEDLGDRSEVLWMKKAAPIVDAGDAPVEGRL